MTKRVRLVLDTNIYISAIGFGGLPRQILKLVIEKKVVGVTSPVLFAELHEVVYKKFPYFIPVLSKFEKKLSDLLTFVNPTLSLEVVRDLSDNRVIEAAVKGECDFIVTGDQDLLVLKKYKKIRIIQPKDFLKQLNLLIP